ncbi:MAG TPA: phosphatase PAP2 family protein [Vicinamibacterales bacterium]|nr:phosphatase PAP2 family protein [Vicinamibacterales bacterium]
MQRPTFFTVLAFCLVPVSVPAAAADVVADWNVAALNAIRVQRTSPPVAARALAILHISIFDAINGIDRSYEHYFVPSGVPGSASIDAAASAAAHRVLVTLFPGQSTSFDLLHASIVNAIDDHPQKRRGLSWGAMVADRILTSRSQDGAAAIVAPPSTTGPGAWVPTPPGFQPYLLPQWGFVTPFALDAGDDFRPSGPPSLDSSTWTDDYNEVKTLGAAVGSTRTAEQSLIALFWADGVGTETPPGHWNSIARGVSDLAETPPIEKARLFALLNVALADASIAAWDAKYAFNFWRPVTAIRAGDSDGNDETTADPGWSSFIATPPFPDYVSGHSTFSGAAATVLALFYGTDEVVFTATSDFLPGEARVFSRLSEAAGEAAMSRLYGGIHYRSANEDGLRCGVSIGAWAFTHVMRPKGNRSR